MKHTASGGLLNLYKPVGITSHDLVERVRVVLGKKCGHTGTLDPFARGVVLVCWGKATRLASFFNVLPKRYRAWIRFGMETDTFDVNGKITRFSDRRIREAEVVAATKEMHGIIKQEVPVFSARKFRGKPLYVYARRGEDIPVFHKTVCIEYLRVVSFREGEFPWAELDVLCSSGTYLRSIAAEVGRKVGSCAYLFSLRREGIGRFDWTESVPVEGATVDRALLAKKTMPADESLYWLDTIHLNREAAQRFSYGNEVEKVWPAETEGHARVYGNGVFLGIGEPGRKKGSVKPAIVLGG